MFKSSIRLKIISIIFIIIIPLAALQFFKINAGFSNKIQGELQANEDFAKVLSLSFINYLEEIWTEEYTMGVAIDSNENWTREDIEKFMKTILKKHDDIIEYSLADNDGNIIASTNKRVVGRNISKREYFKRIKAGEEKVISDLTKSFITGDVILPIARAITIDGKTSGVVISLVDIKKLQNIFPIEMRGNTRRYGLVDSKGRLVYRNGYLDIPYEMREISVYSPGWKALQGEVVKTKLRKSEFDGSERMGIDYPITQIGWECFVTTSVDEVLKMHKSILIRDNILLFLTTICSLSFAIWIGNRVVNSVKRLKDAAEAVTLGRFDIKTKVEGYDELAVTSHAFDIMTEKVNDLLLEAEEYNKIKSQFFATVSHELKTPLNIILGAVQLMEKIDTDNCEDMKTKHDRYTALLKQNSYRLLRLINNLIDVNKIESDGITVKLKNSDIVKTVEDITLSVVEYTKLKNLELVFDTDIEEKIIAFDPDKIERIILNLLSNAIKFTNEGGAIFVNIFDRKDKIAIIVKDTGVGIPQGMIKKIFDCFTQVDDTLRRRAEGSGIGLSLVKSLIELHGGTINVVSELGKGSEFIIELPCTLIEGNENSIEQSCSTNVERIKIEFSDIYL